MRLITQTYRFVKGTAIYIVSALLFVISNPQGKFAYKVEFGDFGEARKELAEATGCDKLNAHITSSFFNFKVIVGTLFFIHNTLEGEGRM